jgi:MEMO1 family protein
VFLVGPSHRLAFSGTAAWDGDAFLTPLGRVAVDRQAIAELRRTGAGVVEVRNAAHDDEHALEVELPFLQRRLGAFSLVPLLMGRQDAPSASRLATALAAVVRPERGDLMIASSDLSHYHPYGEAVTLDRLALERVAAWDPEGFFAGLAEHRFEACGGGPIGALLMAARLAGGRSAHVLSYMNSGDVTGDRERVVGYAACAVV